MRRRTFAVRRTLALTALVALGCSTGKPPSGDDDYAASGGTGAIGAGGSAASGGATGAVGGTNGGTAGTSLGAAAGMSALGGSGGASGAPVSGTGGALGGSAGMSQGGATAGSPQAGMGAVDPGTCEELSVVSTLEVPTVELLVDTSSSMWKTMPPAWPLLYAALMDAGSGVVAGLQADIRFGFASYKGHLGTSETDPACATMTTVPPALMNRDAIDAVYQDVGSSYDPNDPNKWETPTGYAIHYATGILSDFKADPPGKKYILLVTDGNPNTCQVIDPQCGQDLSIKATQDAFAAGVGLFVLGLGDIVAQPDNGCPAAARCGLLHLQDLANAGVGAGVHPTPGCDDWHASGCTFTHESCNQGQQLLATYTPDAPDVGTPFAVDTSGGDATMKLVAALHQVLDNAISCTVDMDAIVTGNPALGIVSLEGSPLTFGDPNGWKLEDDQHSVTLVGTACDSYKAGAKKLDITFPCDTNGPIAVHR
jgi:hypothetical protein